MEAGGARPGRLTRHSEGSLRPLRTCTPMHAQAKCSPGGEIVPPGTAQPPGRCGRRIPAQPSPGTGRMTVS